MIHNSRLLACWILFTGRDEWLALWTNRSTAGRRRAHVSTSNSVAAFSSSTAARRLMRLSYWAWVMLTAMARGLDGLSRRQGARSRRRVCRESRANWAAQRPHEADFGTPLPSSYAGIRLFCYVNDELHTTISTQARFFKTRMGLGSLALRACMFTRFYKNAISIMCCSLQYFLSTLVSGRVRAWPCVRAAWVA